MAKVLLYAAAILALATLPAAAQQESLGMSPARIEVVDAIPGESYVRILSLQNQFDSPSTITINLTGETGAWSVATPASGFVMAPRSQQQVRITIHVPDSAGPGEHAGQVAFVTEPKSSASGSGASVRHGVAAPITVQVGGTPIVALEWIGARAPDASSAAPPIGYAMVRNAGNVRAKATMDARVTPFGGGTPLMSASGELELDPGSEGDVEVLFAATLEPGQYVMEFTSRTPAGFAKSVEFKVARPGENPPSGLLRGLIHPTQAQAGDRLRIDGWFANTGTVGIGSAKLRVEVREGDRLVEVLDSDALAVPPGREVNLTVYWTPPAAGTYGLVGQVTYDGRLSLPGESRVTIQGDAGGIAWWWWLLLALVVLGIAAWLLSRRRKDPRRGSGHAGRAGGEARDARDAREGARPDGRKGARRGSSQGPSVDSRQDPGVDSRQDSRRS